MDNCFELVLSLLIMTSSIVIATPQCKPGGGARQPDFNNCHRFYVCSKASPDNAVPWVSGFGEECPYPELFNIETMACEAGEEVKCGSRYKPTTACEYTLNLCTDLYCQPCRNDFPECSDNVAVDNSADPGPFPHLPKTKCGYTKHIQRLTCPIDKNGKRIPLDASVCHDDQKFPDGVII